MKAALLTKIPATDLEVREIRDPLPGPGEVLVSVDACGICGTDLHVMAGESYRPDLPFVLGHEPAGRIAGIGSGVASGLIGMRVVPALFVGCGDCAPCLRGDERLCAKDALITGVLKLPGGFSELMTLRESQLVQVPAQLSASVAASLVDAGPTAYNAARVASGMVPAGGHLVAGAGPVGFLAASLLRARELQVTVAEPNPARRHAAAAAGLEVVQEASSVAGQFGCVIDCAGQAAVVGTLLDLLEPGGLYLSVGYAVLREFDLAVVARRELTIRGIRSGRRSDLEAVLLLAAHGELALPPIDTWPLDHINDAFSALRAGSVAGKAVVSLQPKHPSVD
jgi:alcohol dehydrogenase, propanol-preferring